MSQSQEISHTNSCEEQIILHQILIKIINELAQLMQSVQRLVIILKQAPDVLRNQSIQSFENKLSTSLISFYIKNADKFRVQEDTSRNSNILKRFSCRIMQFLLTYKQRIQSSDSLKQMEQIIRKLQNVLHILQQNNNFIKFLCEVKNTFLSFISSIKKKAVKQIIDKSLINLVNQNRKGKKLESSATEKDSRSKTFQFQHQYQKKMKAIVSDLNSRFKTIQCMDLDYSHFRATYFQARNNTDFYTQYRNRNQLISNQILNYQRDYRSYTIKKDKRRTQRALQIALKKRSFSKTFVSEEQSNPSHSLSVDPNPYSTKNKYSFIYPGKMELKKYSLQDQLTNDLISLNQRQKTKKLYGLKNIILTASKIKAQPYISIQRANLKNTLRQLNISKKKSLKMQQKSILEKIQQISKRFSPAR